VRREETDVLALSLLTAAGIASGHVDPLAYALDLHGKIRHEADTSAAPDHDSERARFDLHAQLVAAALAAGRDAREAISVADSALAAIYEREDGALT
jgi:hypothetical protein